MKIRDISVPVEEGYRYRYHSFVHPYRYLLRIRDNGTVPLLQLRMPYTDIGFTKKCYDNYNISVAVS
jgi:hypothetical protein